MLQEVEKRDDLSFSMKKKVLGRLHSQILKTSLNPQGKLLIPKAWCEVPGLNSEEHVVLVGRGSYFEIFSPENYEEMLVREEAETAALNDELGFF